MQGRSGRFFVSCGKGLEYLLVDELSALGVARASAASAGVNVQGDQADALRAVLWSRLGSRVLWPLASFEAGDADALYAGTHALPWLQHLGPEQRFAVDAHLSGGGITHARYAAQRVKDAVVDHLRAVTGARPDVDPNDAQVRLHLVVRKGRATLAIDLSGGSMHRRGWRCIQGEAPLKETLAAGVLMRGRWSQVWQDGGALLDPMCGSGTLLIEAALIAADVAPGLARHGDRPPTHWKGFDAQAWQVLLAQARTRARLGRAGLRRALIGRDRDHQAIRAAQANAEAAGVAEALDLRVAEITALPATLSGRLPSVGLVACNPPYDLRLAADPALYRALGRSLIEIAPDWRASILCGSAELAFATGLRARKAYPIFNGARPCTLIVADPIRPAPRLRAAPDALPPDAQMAANRLRKNLDKTRGWRERQRIDCWRAYDADIPEYAAAVDVYTEADCGRRWLHVQEYAPPASVPAERARARLQALLLAARRVFEVEPGRVALKTRMIGKGGARYGRFGTGAPFLIVREGQARLQVNLFDHLDTGLFLDHRPLRLRLAREARGKRFLNLFCYTGAATVQAVIGGAAKSVSVDLSATYLHWLADNLRQNRIGGDAHRIEQADVLAWLAADRRRYDLVFCDPPTFSNSKRAGDFDIQRDHLRLLRLALARVSDDGVLYFSNNSRRFRLDWAALTEFAVVEDISEQTIDVDFARNRRIHRCWRLRRR